MTASPYTFVDRLSRADIAENWHHWAACANRAIVEVDGQKIDLFFPERGQTPKAALQMCASCPVSEYCRNYAIKHEIPHGVWGSMSAEARRSLTARKRTSDKKEPSRPSRGRSRNPELIQRNEQIRKARAEGVSARKLAEHFGLTINTIYRIAGPVSTTTLIA